MRVTRYKRAMSMVAAAVIVFGGVLSYVVIRPATCATRLKMTRAEWSQHEARGIARQCANPILLRVRRALGNGVCSNPVWSEAPEEDWRTCAAERIDKGMNASQRREYESWKAQLEAVDRAEGIIQSSYAEPEPGESHAIQRIDRDDVRRKLGIDLVAEWNEPKSTTDMSVERTELEEKVRRTLSAYEGPTRDEFSKMFADYHPELSTVELERQTDAAQRAYDRGVAAHVRSTEGLLADLESTPDNVAVLVLRVLYNPYE